jgi:hypothetical protein
MTGPSRPGYWLHVIGVALAGVVAAGAGVEAVGQVDVGRQQVAGLVDQADARGARLATLPATMLMTAAICFRLQRAARFQLHHHRGRRFLAVDDTKEVDLAIDRCTRACDRVQRHDRLRQLAFQAAAEAHVLHELRHAQRVVLVHQFQPGRQLRGHALGGQQHAHLAQHGVGHQHLAAVGVHAVGDVVAVQHGHHVRRRHFSRAPNTGL